MEEVLNGYVTNPKPYPYSNPNQINKKIQKETWLYWKLIKWRNVSLVDGN
jgi:hypothetical protein